MQFGDRWWYHYACAAGGVFNVLLMMGANLAGFVLGVDGARYFAQELVSSWAGTFSESPLLPLLIKTRACRDSIFARCLCVPVRRRTAHVRI